MKGFNFNQKNPETQKDLSAIRQVIELNQEIIQLQEKLYLSQEKLKTISGELFNRLNDSSLIVIRGLDTYHVTIDDGNITTVEKVEMLGVQIPIHGITSTHTEYINENH